MSDNSSLRPLMYAQIKAEMETYDKLHVSSIALYDLINVMSGVASNATACGACQLLNRSANEVLDRFEQATGVKREEAYRGAKHKPNCLSLDNVLGRHECDCR